MSSLRNQVKSGQAKSSQTTSSQTKSGRMKSGRVTSALTALGLLCASVSGLALVATIVAPPAMAQRAQKPPPPPKVAKEFAVPFNESLKALQAKDFATALAQADLAAPHATTPQQKYDLEKLRIPALASLGDKARLVQALEAALALGVGTPEESKTYRNSLPGLYTELGDQPKAIAATKAYVEQYGGSAQQYAFLLSVAVRDKVFADAKSYGAKALSQARAEGKVPEERWHGLLIRAATDANDAPAYLDAVEAAYADYPKPEYLRAIAQQAEKAPNFNRNIIGLDIFRALAGAGVALSDREKVGMANIAILKALPIEAETILKPMIDAGVIGGASDAQADANRKLYAQAQAGAKTEKAGGLASSEVQANKAATGSVAVLTGEAFMGSGDYAKAVALLKSGIAKGGLNEGETALAKLHLGIAQLKSGDKPGALASFAEVGGQNGAKELARIWLIAAKK
jgi:hypothetical protein